MPEDKDKGANAVQTAKDYASMAKGVAKTFLLPRSKDEENNVDYSPGPEPKPKTPSPPAHWYKESDQHGMPSYKEGTKYVPKTGPAILHKGEAVIPKERNMAKHNVSLYRAMHHLNRGGLHRALNVPENENIPPAKLKAAKHSKNEHVQHMANMAATMKGFKK